ncbi:hypothetical protein [Trichloromonas sp.]|jgi:hypothetical protein|uniref:hypothetical protein n=1 Tax=Trichloromonas sp. TaxID=3069249 RepID=UPI002A461111|nr:hypothetical protein [Trichloromonas sp.]
MSNILKFNDFLNKIEEGVGDKYLKRKHNISDEFEDFEKTYNKSKLKKDDIIGTIGKTSIIKNPSNLDNIEYGVRCVITKNGDLYISDSMSDVIHNDILLFLKNKGIISESHIKWENLENRKPNEFITVQRVWNKDIIAIGESYMIPKRGEEKQNALNLFVPFFNNAKIKNPNIKFVPLTIKSAVREYLNEKEISDWRTKGSGS